MPLFLLLFLLQSSSPGLLFENARHPHFASTPEGVTLDAGPGWLRLPRVLLDYELTFEYRMTDRAADAGVVLRSWIAEGQWPERGYRVRLPPPNRSFESDFVSGRRKGVRAVRQPSPGTNAPEWRSIVIRAERQRISITLDGIDAGEYEVAAAGGHVLFDVRKGAVQLRKISVRELEAAPATDPAVPAAGAPGTEGITMPEVLHEERPVYPRDVRSRRIQGVVELQAVVLPDGTVGPATVVKGVDLDLDRSALAALRLWRFRPGTKAGVAVPVRVTVELTFALR
jgi:TonB family protein